VPQGAGMCTENVFSRELRPTRVSSGGWGANWRNIAITLIVVGVCCTSTPINSKSNCSARRPYARVFPPLCRGERTLLRLPR